MLPFLFAFCEIKQISRFSNTKNWQWNFLIKFFYILLWKFLEQKNEINSNKCFMSNWDLNNRKIIWPTTIFLTSCNCHFFDILSVDCRIRSKRFDHLFWLNGNLTIWPTSTIRCIFSKTVIKWWPEKSL